MGSAPGPPTAWTRSLWSERGRPGRSPGRLVLGHVARVVAPGRAQSLIVFGPTQSRKTSGLAGPAILGWEGPVIAASVKTDLLEHTIDHRRTCGTCPVLRSVGVNWIGFLRDGLPLPASRTWPGARRAADGLTEWRRRPWGR